MPLTASELAYAGNGEVYVAPVGTAMPTLTSTALNAAFNGLGYTTEDGVTFTPSADTNEIRAWQAFYPLDRRVTARGMEVSFTLMQANARTFALNFNGVFAANSAEWKFTPSAPEVIDYRAMIVHLVDGADITRLLIPKVMVSSPGSIQYKRSDPAEIALTLSLITTGSGDPFNVLSTKSSFNPA